MKGTQISAIRFRAESFAEPHRIHTRSASQMVSQSLTPPSPIAFVRKILRALCCVGIFLHGLPLFFQLWLSGRSDWGARWAQWISKKFLRLIDCEVRVFGIVPESGLIVSNHLSYLDIVVISSVCRAAFISKSDVRQWPIFGLLTRMAGTVFVDRGRRIAVCQQLTSVASILKTGLPVVLFAEGTSSDGSTVLPFRSSLFEAAIISQSPITPAAISYQLQGGSVGDEICYWRDMIFAHHFWNLLGKRSLKATLRFGAPEAPLQGRKQHACTLRLAVVQLRGKN